MGYRSAGPIALNEAPVLLHRSILRTFWPSIFTSKEIDKHRLALYDGTPPLSAEPALFLCSNRKFEPLSMIPSPSALTVDWYLLHPRTSRCLGME